MNISIPTLYDFQIFLNKKEITGTSVNYSRIGSLYCELRDDTNDDQITCPLHLFSLILRPNKSKISVCVCKYVKHFIYFKDIKPEEYSYEKFIKLLAIF